MTSITADSTVFTANRERSAQTSRKGIWIGRVLSSLGVLFMLFDGGAKVFDLIPPEVKAASSYGWSGDSLFTIGALALLCTTLYVIPRTAVLGAILLTGYFGGAIATHLRVGNPLFSHTLFPIYIAVLFWLGLYLRDARVRALFAPRK